MITAYQLGGAWSRTSPKDTAALVFSDALGLEDLVDPDRPAGPVKDLNLPEIPDGPLREFLLNDQAGSLEVAKRIFRAVSEHRRGAFRAASGEPTVVPGEPLFLEVPEDPGHFPDSYFRHVLQGVRRRPPSYVQQIRRRTEVSDIDPGTSGYMVAAQPPPQPRRPRRPQHRRRRCRHHVARQAVPGLHGRAACHDSTRGTLQAQRGRQGHEDRGSCPICR